MTQSAIDLLQSWKDEQSALIVIDETRLPSKAGKELIAYTLVITTKADAYRWLADSTRIRSQILRGISQHAVFKGSKLFGPRKRASHESLRHFVIDKFNRAQRIYHFITTQENLARSHESETRDFRSVASSDDPNPLTHTGDEFFPLMNAIEEVILDTQAPPGTVTLVVDRSRKLGLAPSQTNSAREDFVTLGPVKLGDLLKRNPQDRIEDFEIQIIAASEEGIFRDLLLIPDAIGYLGLFASGAWEPKIARLKEGAPYVIWETQR